MKRLLSILCLAALLLTLCSCKKQQPSGDTESPYPYTYVMTKKGMEITITGDFGDNRFQATSQDETVATVEMKQSKAKKAVAAVTAVGEGEDILYLTLQNGDEIKFKIELVILVNSDKSVSFIGSSHTELKDDVSDIAFGQYQYSVTYNNTDSINFTIDQHKDGVWEYKTSNKNAYVFNTEVSETTFKLTLNGLTNGADILTIYSPKTGETIRVSLNIATDKNEITVTGVACTNEPPQQEEEQKEEYIDDPGEMEEIGGKVDLYDEFENQSMGTKSIIEGESLLGSYIEYAFQYEGVDFVYMYSKELNATRLAAFFEKEGSTSTPANSNGITVNMIHNPDIDDSYIIEEDDGKGDKDYSNPDLPSRGDDEEGKKNREKTPSSAVIPGDWYCTWQADGIGNVIQTDTGTQEQLKAVVDIITGAK